MDYWENFKNTIRNKATSHTPLSIFGTQRFYSSLSGVQYFSSIYDPELFCNTQLQIFNEYYKIVFIPGAWPDYGAGVILPSAFGAVPRWSQTYPPSIAKPAIDLNSIDGLRKPNLETDGLCYLYLQTLRYFKEKMSVRPEVLKTAWSIGPGELISFIWNIKDFFIACYEDKNKVEKLIELTTDVIISWYHLQLSILDEAECLLLTDDISGMLSREMYKDILYDSHRRIRDEFDELIVIFHNDTRSEHIMDYFVDLGFDVWNVGVNDRLEKVIGTIGKEISIMGNIDPINLIRNGTSEEVRRACLNCLKIGEKSGKFILSLGGGANEQTPRSNINAMIEAVEEFHK